MGNSGGALIDAKGRLVGINSAIISTTHGNIGIGLAIPVNLAAGIMRSLIETGSVTRGYLGVQVEPVTSEVAEALSLKKETKAVIVTGITKGGPAEKAGLKRSDAILSIDDRGVTSLQDLRLLISQLAPDTDIAIKILRDGKEITVNARLGRLTDDASQNALFTGVEIVRLTGELRRQLNLDDRIDGLVVTTVDRESPYAQLLPPNMVILEINRLAVPDLETARRLIQPGRNLLLVYVHGAYRYIAIMVKG
jgi:serine protease Do/serine protease DegQ